MIRSARCLLLPLAAAGVVCSATAQEPLTWEQCRQQAMRASPHLAAARATVRAARALCLAEDSESSPRIKAVAGAGLIGRNADDPNDNDDFTAGCALTVQGDWNLYSGGRLPFSLDVREAEAEAAEARASIVEADFQQALREAFIELLCAQAFLPLAEEIAHHRQQNTDAVELRYEAGLEHKGALAASRAAGREALAEVQQATRALQGVRKRLARAMGQESDAFAAQGDLEPGVPPETLRASECVPNTPEYRLAMFRVAASQAGVGVARSGTRPNLDVVASFTPQTDDWSSEEARWFAGLKLSYLLPVDGRVRHETAAATAKRDATRASLEATAREISDRIEIALAEYQAAVDRVELVREALQAAELLAKVAREEYSEGLLGFVNWDLAESELIAKRKAFLRSRRDACLARVRWERAYATPAALVVAGAGSESQ